RHDDALTGSTIGGRRNSYARKCRTYHLDGLLPERAHGPLCIWHPSLLHHLPLSEKPEAGADACPLFCTTAEGDGAVADLQRGLCGRAIDPFGERVGLSSGAFANSGTRRFNR